MLGIGDMDKNRNKERTIDNVLNGKCILLAEDNALVAEIEKELLEFSGASVEIAENGERAVARVFNYYTGYYDLVLLDIHLGGYLDGYQTAKEIRQVPWASMENVPIIGVLEYDYEQERDKDERGNRVLNAYCKKPLDILELKTILYEHELEQRK